MRERPLIPEQHDEIHPTVTAHLLGQFAHALVERVVKLLGMVNCTADFKDQPKVINGASDLLVAVFGEAGKHARSAVGMQSLPNGIPVEIEMILEFN